MKKRSKKSNKLNKSSIRYPSVKRYVTIEIPDEFDEEKYFEKKDFEKDLRSLEKHPQIPLAEEYGILNELRPRLGKMRIEDIAEELDIGITVAEIYRAKIISKLNYQQKDAILEQEQKIEKLRNAILSGEMKKRLHNHSYGVEGLLRGIIRDLTKEGKSIKEIKDQINVDTSTISYHRRRIKNREKRKYHPRIMNMIPGKDKKVKRLLKKNKRQKDICDILNISSATASVIVSKIKGGENNENSESKKSENRGM